MPPNLLANSQSTMNKLLDYINEELVNQIETDHYNLNKIQSSFNYRELKGRPVDLKQTKNKDVIQLIRKEFADVLTSNQARKSKQNDNSKYLHASYEPVLYSKKNSMPKHEPTNHQKSVRFELSTKIKLDKGLNKYASIGQINDVISQIKRGFPEIFE
jgi:hypothetical protein